MYDEAGFVARVDFAWPDKRVAVEYEGRWHGERQNVAKDRRRLNHLTAAGWTVIFVTAEDLRDPVQLVARIAAELAAAHWMSTCRGIAGGRHHDESTQREVLSAQRGA